MPVSYPIQTVQPANPAQYWLQGVSQGTAIANARNSVALQQQRLAAEERQNQQNAARQQQQLEMTQAYQQEQLNLQKAELEQANQKITLATQAAAQKLQAQQQYQQLVQGGMDPAEAMLKIGPSLGMSAGDLGAAYRSRMYEGRGAKKPELTTTPGGAEYVTDAYGRVHFAPRQQRAQLPQFFQAGPVQAEQVVGSNGQPMPGVFATRNPKTGAPSIHTLPDQTGRIHREALAEIKRLEEGPYGRLLAGDVAELPEASGGKDAKKKEAYAKTKARYDQLKRALEGESAGEETAGTGTAGGTGGITFTRIREKGSDQWQEIGGGGPTDADLDERGVPTESALSKKPDESYSEWVERTQGYFQSK